MTDFAAKPAFYITTPIYYVNDRPHIGHAYTSVACDVLARFMRLAGHEVKFLTGTDEHGQKVEKSAEANVETPQDFVNRVSQHFRDLAVLMHISHDDFIRTTEPRHVQTAQALWKKMQANDTIYLGKYAGWYAVRDEAFYAESELVNGAAPTGAPVEWVEEPSYFFRLSAFADKLLAFYEAHPDFIKPDSRRNEVLQFVRGGLTDLSISRTSFRWGIPVPGDERHIMYVWLDALANYLSALGYPESPEMRFWPANLHMVGKDILRFHAVYWPAFLMAADLPVPRHIFAHGWWTIEGEKMSKSLGNVVAPSELVARFGLDQTRYFLLREVPFGADGNFSRERMTAVINAELANTIGNLVQRSLSFAVKHCDAAWPAAPDAATLARELEKILSPDLRPQFFDPDHINDFTVQCLFGGMLGSILQSAWAANHYIDAQAPWKQKTESPEQMRQTLYVLMEAIRQLAIMLQPFMPASMARCLAMLGYGAEAAERGLLFAVLDTPLPSGTKLGEVTPLFPKLETA